MTKQNNLNKKKILNKILTDVFFLDIFLKRDLLFIVSLCVECQHKGSGCDFAIYNKSKR